MLIRHSLMHHPISNRFSAEQQLLVSIPPDCPFPVCVLCGCLSNPIASGPKSSKIVSEVHVTGDCGWCQAQRRTFHHTSKHIFMSAIYLVVVWTKYVWMTCGFRVFVDERVGKHWWWAVAAWHQPPLPKDHHLGAIADNTHIYIYKADVTIGSIVGNTNNRLVYTRNANPNVSQSRTNLSNLNIYL